MNDKYTPAMPVAKKYRHIFFDLDHTLWDFDTNAKETLSEVFNIFNLESRINTSFIDFYNITPQCHTLGQVSQRIYQ